jgi:Transposase zinc-binding domain
MARRRPAQEAPCAAHPAPARALHHERHRPEQTTLYCLVQQHAAHFIAHTEASTRAALPRFIKDEFDAFLECGILAHGFLRLRCGECGDDKLLAFSCKRRGFCPSCGARRMSQTAAHVVDQVIPHVPVRQSVLSPAARAAGCAARVRRACAAGGGAVVPGDQPNRSRPAIRPAGHRFAKSPHP